MGRLFKFKVSDSLLKKKDRTAITVIAILITIAKDPTDRGCNNKFITLKLFSSRPVIIRKTILRPIENKTVSMKLENLILTSRKRR